MDINTIETVLRPRLQADLPDWRDGDAWLAGGTWLFSEPQRHLRRLVDLGGLGWPPAVIDASGLSLAATCTIAQLDRLDLPGPWAAAPLIGQCCRALLGSFKIWNVATVGGNLCLALPAGPMIALATALEASARIWTPDGGERRLPVLDLVLGPRMTALRPGEVLRALDMPVSALKRVRVGGDVRNRAIQLTLVGRQRGRHDTRLIVRLRVDRAHAAAGRVARMPMPRQTPLTLRPSWLDQPVSNS